MLQELLKDIIQVQNQRFIRELRRIGTYFTMMMISGYILKEFLFCRYCIIKPKDCTEGTLFAVFAGIGFS